MTDKEYREDFKEGAREALSKKPVRTMIIGSLVILAAGAISDCKDNLPKIVGSTNNFSSIHVVRGEK